MSLDLSQAFRALGDEAIAKIGDQVGLDREQSMRVAEALASRVGQGREAAVAAAAEETGLAQEVVAAMFGKLAETAAEKALSDSPVGNALGAFKAPVAEGVAGVVGEGAAKGAGGLMSKLFGRK
ncbi:MAG: hypothetical protein HXY28_08670 [Hydrogenophilaceae bacterium]|jgi:hypothetical protein|nr:hypothetical protein [Hydrogenophilaceae bacterium]